MGTRKKAALLRSAPGATKRAAVLGMTEACVEIRELLVTIPRIWATKDPEDPDSWPRGGTPAQHRAFRRVMAMRDKLAWLVHRLGKKKAHTMPELATLVLHMTWERGFYNNTVDGWEVVTIEALLRSLCGVDPRDAPEWA